jgi:hypothetical protein
MAFSRVLDGFTRQDLLISFGILPHFNLSRRISRTVGYVFQHLLVWNESPAFLHPHIDHLEENSFCFSADSQRHVNSGPLSC